MYYNEDSNMLGYIIFSTVGDMSHIIMNNNGEVYEVAPLTTNGSVRLFQSLTDATCAAVKFKGASITGIKFIAIKCKL